MKISVVMASFLGEYPGCSKNRDKKYIRAVNSFINQTHEDKELIIVADGCQKTVDIYNQNWKDNPQIKLFHSPKQPLFSGGIRSIGLKIAKGDIICYLDNDDVIGTTHLQTIHDQFDVENYDWVYYDDYLVLDKEFKKFQVRYVEPRHGSIGTSSIAHKNLKCIDWQYNGYSHDFSFMLSLNAKGLKYKKLEKAPQYLVCHYGGGADF